MVPILILLTIQEWLLPVAFRNRCVAHFVANSDSGRRVRRIGSIDFLLNLDVAIPVFKAAPSRIITLPKVSEMMKIEIWSHQQKPATNHSQTRRTRHDRWFVSNQYGVTQFSLPVAFSAEPLTTCHFPITETPLLCSSPSVPSMMSADHSNGH